MARIDKKVMLKRMDIATNILRKLSVLAPDESLSLDQTGSTKYPYRVVVENDRGTIPVSFTEGVTLQQADAVVDALYNMAYLLQANEQNGGAYCKTHDMFRCFFAHARVNA